MKFLNWPFALIVVDLSEISMLLRSPEAKYTFSVYENGNACGKNEPLFTKITKGNCYQAFYHIYAS